MKDLQYYLLNLWYKYSFWFIDIFGLLCSVDRAEYKDAQDPELFQTFCDEGSSDIVEFQYPWGNALNGDLSWCNPKNIKAEEGIGYLIRTRREDGTGWWYSVPDWEIVEVPRTYSTALLWYHHWQKYGKWTAKIMLPDEHGLFPAFWHITAETCLPEIDLEWFFKVPRDRRKIVPGFIWERSYEEDTGRRKSLRIWGKKMTGRYYLVSMAWTPGELVWRINNRIIFRHYRGVDEMIRPINLIINVAVGDWNLSPSMDVSTHIDYVRIYQFLQYSNFTGQSISDSLVKEAYANLIASLKSIHREAE